MARFCRPELFAEDRRHLRDGVEVGHGQVDRGVESLPTLLLKMRFKMQMENFMEKPLESKPRL